MARVAKNPLKQIYINKVDKWVSNFKEFDSDVEEFKQEFITLLNNEIKLLKDCPQKVIVNCYINAFDNLNQFNKYQNKNNDGWYDLLKSTARKRISHQCTKKLASNANIIDIYFNDVKKEYIRNPLSVDEPLEFCDENRDIFIKNNLKLVVDCAKRYTNLGLPFEDLIQAGNVGLCTAFNKFDKERGNLKNHIIKSIKESELDKFKYEDAKKIIVKNFSYDKNLEKTLKSLPENGFDSKESFLTWVNKNVKSAIFASVAFMWIKAIILYELSKYSRIIHIPKSQQQKNGFIPTIIKLDSLNPRTEDCYHDNEIAEVANEEFLIEDENIERIERQSNLSGVVDKLLYSLTNQERNIIKQRFGIGLPYPLTVNEIADNEGISVNKVKYHINNILMNLQNKLNDKEKEMIVELIS